MNVASLELCKELYELSGWNDSTYWFTDYMGQDIGAIPRDYGNDRGGYTWRLPAYDLGYLLRKLPNGQRIVKSTTDYYVVNNIDGITEVNSDGLTPEDALTSFAIYLFKQGLE